MMPVINQPQWEHCFNMRYKKGTFITIPNRDYLFEKPAIQQALFFWLCSHADEEGICFPSRARLAKAINCDIRTIDKYIKTLEEDGILIKTKRRKVGDKTNKSNLYQIIIQGESNVEQGEPNVVYHSEPNPPVTESSINSIQEDTSSGKITITLGRKGESSVAVLQRLFSHLFQHLYGFKPKSTTYPQMGGVFKQLLKDYSEIQIACLLIVFFNWQGMTDSSPKEKDWLISTAHSIYQFRGGISKYEAYIRNYKDMGKEFENDEELITFVRKSIP